MQVFGENDKRRLFVTYEFPDYGEATFLDSGDGRESVYRADPKERINRSMMPTEYMDKTGADFDWSLYEQEIGAQKKIVNAFVTRYAEFEKDGRGLYISSRAKGTGKTYLACILANEITRRRPFSVKFMTTVDLIELIKSRDETDKQVMDGLYSCRLLILDDIGAQDTDQKWINEAIFRLIDYRYREKRPVIFTSNCDAEKLSGDERIADRISAMTIPLKMPEVKIRRKIAERASGEFLKSVL